MFVYINTEEKNRFFSIMFLSAFGFRGGVEEDKDVKESNAFGMDDDLGIWPQIQNYL